MVLHIEPAAIEINAPPERVREVVLDFPNLSTWHTKHFKSIAVKGNKSPKDLVKGDKLEVKLATLGISFSPEIIENSPEKFHWIGSAPLLFTGDHMFEFQPSQINPGGTRFVQWEDFSGMLKFIMDPEKKKSGMQNMEGFVAFNEDLKRKCESGV